VPRAPSAACRPAPAGRETASVCYQQVAARERDEAHHGVLCLDEQSSRSRVPVSGTTCPGPYWLPTVFSSRSRTSMKRNCVQRAWHSLRCGGTVAPIRETRRKQENSLPAGQAKLNRRDSLKRSLAKFTRQREKPSAISKYCRRVRYRRRRARDLLSLPKSGVNVSIPT
jgi:hypothetical protein